MDCSAKFQNLTMSITHFIIALCAKHESFIEYQLDMNPEKQIGIANFQMHESTI